MKTSFLYEHFYIVFTLLQALLFITTDCKKWTTSSLNKYDKENSFNHDGIISYQHETNFLLDSVSDTQVKENVIPVFEVFS